MKKGLLIFTMVCGLFFLSFLSVHAETSPGKPNVEKIPGGGITPLPSPSIPSSKTSCFLQYDNGVALTFFPNWNPGDKNSIYFDPETCDIPYPYPYPFQITGVELLLYNHAAVESVQLKFWIQEMGADICEGPQATISVSPIYTVTTFHPDWATVTFTDGICVDGPFFFSIEYFSGTPGTIPGVAMDDQQDLVDTCFQWIWRDPQSPPWHEWHRFWGEPDPGWLMVKLEGETYSLACETDWYWKAENEYAPSGMPDVDQNQGDWSAYCAPVAIGNSLQWFGVSTNLEWNLTSLIDTIAAYIQTESTGTKVQSIQPGLESFFNNYQIDWIYHSTWQMPDFHVMQESLEVSQNIILLLGFWWWDGEGWWREGGHFLTLAGVKSEGLKIAISDPGRDAAEYGWPGRVRPPDHPPPPHDDTLHNDPLYVSHDIYQCDLECPSPGNQSFWLPNYLEFDPEFPRQYTGQNFPSEFVDSYQPAPPGTTYVSEVEYAIMICPKREHWYWEPSFEDYAPSGMPDFDQKQDGWANPETEQPAFCGPVAVANCFWWFDSKHNFPPGVPGDSTDLFPLVRDYLDNNPPLVGFDDHDMWNLDHSGTFWFPGTSPARPPQPFVPGPQPTLPSWGELVERLAWDMDTDGHRSETSLVGTKVDEMEEAINVWLYSEIFLDGSVLRDTLCGRAWQMPTFSLVNFWVRNDFGVILLLGFWYWDGDSWWRVGGHYVTVAGVNGAQIMIAFSDPFFDNAETGASGRVLDGDYIPHTPIPHTDSVIHNDAGNVSHDIYVVNLDSISPGGSWWIPDYPASLAPEYFMEIFYQQNVPDEFEPMTQPWVPGYPIHAVVEYAVEIRPLDYRGDCNDDGVINIADLVCMVNYLFMGVPPSASLSELDTNCDGVVNIADVITMVNYLFLGTPAPRCCDP
ncbi:MAG: dockerin type I repeat-containing protein [candidate division Zixibacteria bacterium]|nr:dockerin type I repeat-containing protein [candidate division Zixibacteria bacterium]